MRLYYIFAELNTRMRAYLTEEQRQMMGIHYQEMIIKCTYGNAFCFEAKVIPKVRTILAHFYTTTVNKHAWFSE